MRFSASRLKSWMSCSLAAHYQYDEHLPRRQNAAASFGSIIHTALETYYTSLGDVDAAIKEFKVLWANPEKAGVEPEFWPKFTSHASFRTRGIDILNGVHESHKWQEFTLVACEVPFLVPFGEHELTGFVDLLGIELSGTGKQLLKIIDHKSNAREPNKAALALDIQFTVYAYAVGQREFWMGVPGNPEFPGVENGEWLWETVATQCPRRCVWHQLSTQRHIDAGPRTETDFERLYRLCEQITRAIDAEVYVPKIGTDCTYCDFQEPCKMNIPIAISAASDKSDPDRWL